MSVRPSGLSALTLVFSLLASTSEAGPATPTDAFFAGGWTNLLDAPLYVELSEYAVVEVDGALAIVRATPSGPRYSLFRSGETVLLVPWAASLFDVIINFGQTLTCGVGEVIVASEQRVRFILAACGD